MNAPVTDGIQLFEQYEEFRKANIYSSILMTHLASHYLSPNGYVGWNGSFDVFNGVENLPDFKKKVYLENTGIIEAIGKQTTMKQGLDLSIDRMDENVIYANAKVNVLLFEDLITEKARKSKVEKMRYNNKLESTAALLKFWAAGNNTPENGAFVRFDYS